MKIEPNMYVRTLNGIIKIDKIQNDVIKDTKGCLHYGDFIMASHNIKELIKERDFVKVIIDGVFINWFMVDLFEDEDENEILGIGCYEDGLLNSISEYRPLNTLEILEVITREQIEKESYKISLGG